MSCNSFKIKKLLQTFTIALPWTKPWDWYPNNSKRECAQLAFKCYKKFGPYFFPRHLPLRPAVAFPTTSLAACLSMHRGWLVISSMRPLQMVHSLPNRTWSYHGCRAAFLLANLRYLLNHFEISQFSKFNNSDFLTGIFLRSIMKPSKWYCWQ